MGRWGVGGGLCSVVVPSPEGIQRAGGHGVDVVEGSPSFCWLCVCKCVCASVYVSVCKYTCACVYAHESSACICVCMCLHIEVHVCACVCLCAGTGGEYERSREPAFGELGIVVSVFHLSKLRLPCIK